MLWRRFLWSSDFFSGLGILERRRKYIKSHQLSSLLSGSQKPEKLLPRLSKNDKVDSEIHKKRDLWKHVFAIPSMRKPWIKSPKHQISTQTSIKKWPGNKPKQNWNFEPGCQKHFQTRIPRSIQNQWKSCSGPPRVHPAAPILFQDNLEVPRKSLRVHAKC